MAIQETGKKSKHARIDLAKFIQRKEVVISLVIVLLVLIIGSMSALAILMWTQRNNLQVSPTELSAPSIAVSPSGYELTSAYFSDGRTCQISNFDDSLLNTLDTKKSVTVETTSTKESDNYTDIFLVMNNSDGCVAYYLFNFKAELDKLDLPQSGSNTSPGIINALLSATDSSNVVIYFAEDDNEFNSLNFFSYDLHTKQLTFLKDINKAIFGNYVFKQFSYMASLNSIFQLYKPSDSSIHPVIIFKISRADGIGACDEFIGETLTPTEKIQAQTCNAEAGSDLAKADTNSGLWMYDTSTQVVKKIISAN